jgi:hypothetical protein
VIGSNDTKPIPWKDVVGNADVRHTVARRLHGRQKPIARGTLLRLRETRGFPAPVRELRGGVELWDARQVRAWILEQRHDARSL